MNVVMNAASDPDFWEKASWIATVAACGIAIIAALFAGGQLVDVRRASQATLLLELDARFDSAELREARDLFSSFREQINITVSTNNTNASDAHKVQIVKEEWKKVLAEMRLQDQENYLKLIGYIGFFETVGLMVSRKYIKQDDVFALFMGPLIDIGRSFKLHIDERSNEMGVPDGMFEHALSLSDSASSKKKS